MQPELLVRLPEILSIRLTPRITHQVTPRLGICSASEVKLLQSCKRPISIPFYYSLAEEMKSTSSERFFSTPSKCLVVASSISWRYLLTAPPPIHILHILGKAISHPARFNPIKSVMWPQPAGD